MPNSADKPVELDEDSDIIELTEEVTHRPDPASRSDEIDLLGEFAMPEFHLPGSGEGADGSPQAAILERRPRARKQTPALGTAASRTERPAIEPPLVEDAHETAPVSLDELSGELPDPSQIQEEDVDDLFFDEVSLDEISTPTQLLGERPGQSFAMEPSEPSEPSELEEDAEEGVAPDVSSEERAGEPSSEAQPTEGRLYSSRERYDRQELVRTIQMQPVDRAAFERQLELELLARAPMLSDQRFAPDVLVAPPRALITQWREGSPIQPPANPEAPPQTDERDESAPEAAPPLSEPSSPSVVDPALKRAKSQAPPHNGASAPPPKPSSQPSGATRRPQATGPARTVPSSPPLQQPGGGGDLDGLVQELLDEGQSPKPGRSSSKPSLSSRPSSARDTWVKEAFNEEYLRTISPDIDAITERDIQFIDRSLSLQNGSRILDLACGIGRHSMMLAQRQFEVVGLDISMALLQRALNEAQRRSLSIKFVHGDMRSMNFHNIFDGCFAWQTSFGFFDDVTNFRVLQGITKALKPGGRLLLDVIKPRLRCGRDACALLVGGARVYLLGGERVRLRQQHPPHEALVYLRGWLAAIRAKLLCTLVQPARAAPDVPERGPACDRDQRQRPPTRALSRRQQPAPDPARREDDQAIARKVGEVRRSR